MADKTVLLASIMCIATASAMTFSQQVETAVLSPAQVEKALPPDVDGRRLLFLEANKALKKLPKMGPYSSQDDAFAEVNGAFLKVADKETIEVVAPWLFSTASTNSLKKLSDVPGLPENLNAKFFPSPASALYAIEVELGKTVNDGSAPARMDIVKKMFNAVGIDVQAVESPMPAIFAQPLMSNWHTSTNAFFVEELEMDFGLDRTPRPLNTKRRGDRPDWHEPIPYPGQGSIE